MRYSHQAIDLRAPLRKEELERHLRILHQAFARGPKSTGYWMEEGVLKKEVTRSKYLIYPIDGESAIALEIGSKPKSPFNSRYATFYPQFNFAVLGAFRGYKADVHERAVRRKVESLGYRLATSVARKKFDKRSWEGKSPYEILIDETGMFRSDEVFAHILDNVNVIAGGRPESGLVEIVCFAPPGDGGMSPIGRSELEEAYEGPPNPILFSTALNVQNGTVDAEKLRAIFKELAPSITIGISSKRQRPISMREGGASQPLDRMYDEFLWKGFCSPMVDFRCHNPEEAIRTFETLGVDPRAVVLLDSGNSFHAHFPSNVLDKEAGERYLLSLEGQEGVCNKWVPLQMKQGYQLLRVAPCLRKPTVPVVLK